LRQIWVGASQEAPGVIRHTASEHTDIGLYPNPEIDAALESERLERFAAMLRAGKTSYKISDNIQVKRWEKVVWNVSPSECSNGKQSTNCPGCVEPSYHTNTTKHTRVALLVERKRVHHKTTDAGSDKCGEKSRSYVRVWTCRHIDGKKVDAKEGRRLEVDVILGTPMRMAREFGMDVPTLATIYALTVAVDLRIKQGLGNLS
jgi:hypothetical protein